MDRRQFIQVGLVGTAGALVIPKMVLAQIPDSPMAGGVYYTEKAPGRWSKKVALHLPSIEIEKGKDALSVQVRTSHPMDGYEHYIVKHVLLDKNFNFLDENMFDPTKDKAPFSTFKLQSYEGALYALSVCNKHDTWLNMVEV